MVAEDVSDDLYALFSGGFYFDERSGKPTPASACSLSADFLIIDTWTADNFWFHGNELFLFLEAA